jgi:hypothetical protein
MTPIETTLCKHLNTKPIIENVQLVGGNLANILICLDCKRIVIKTC